MKKIAIFASGSGSNAENIATYFASNDTARVALILSNRADAPVLQRAARLGIESVVFDRDTFYKGDKIVELLAAHGIDYVVLAGFLWLVPDNLLKAYPDKIVNIHPSLIPSFSGKGFYGLKVHEEALRRGVKITGATVHLVNEIPDGGKILFQKAVNVEDSDTPEILQQRVMREAEWVIFPKAVEYMSAKIEGERT